MSSVQSFRCPFWLHAVAVAGSVFLPGIVIGIGTAGRGSLLSEMFIIGGGLLLGWVFVWSLVHWARRVDVSADGLRVWPLLGRERRIRWSDVRRVRQIWNYGGLEKDLHIFVNGRRGRIVLSGKYFRNHDELLSIVLREVPEQKLDRRKVTVVERLLHGQHVPTADQERNLLTGSERRRVYVAVVVGTAVPLLIYLAVVLRQGR